MKNNNIVCWSRNGETLELQAWRENAIRERAWKHSMYPKERGTLLEIDTPLASIRSCDGKDILGNGMLSVTVDENGRLSFGRTIDEAVLLEEPCTSTTPIRYFPPRYYLPTGTNSQRVRFEFTAGDEMIRGMGNSVTVLPITRDLPLTSCPETVSFQFLFSCAVSAKGGGPYNHAGRK